MRYCLFCRESFEDEVESCPYCGDDLLDELPDEDYGEEAFAPHEGRPAPEEGDSNAPRLVQVAMITTAEDLEAAVAVLKEAEIYFEIEEADRLQAMAGITPGRTWRLLVDEDRSQDAFLSLVTKIPQAFPGAVVAAAEETDGPPVSAAEDLEKLKAILEERPSDLTALELAKFIISVFSSGDGISIASGKAALVRHGVALGPLVADIAVEAAGNGGEGAEQVLFHSLEVLEALGYDGALEGFEQLYSSAQTQVRMRAAYAAGRLGNIGAVDALLELLEDGDEDVRYEASEAIWRLTGFDFEFEPYAPVEEERENAAKLRRMWEAGRGSARVRNRVTLSGILKSLGEDDQ